MPETDASQTSFTRRQRWLATVNLCLGTAAVLAILALVNYVADGHGRRFQWARMTNFGLSPQTRRVLDSLTNDVTATIFYSRSQQGDSDVYGMIRGLLAEYQHSSRHVVVKELDYEVSPGDARNLLARLHLAGSNQKDFVAFESNGHSKICPGRDLSDYDFSDVLSGRSKYVRRTAFLGESKFTAAIFAVSYPRERKAYFLAGHGERDPGDPSGTRPAPGDTGMTKLAAILKDEIDCGWQRLELAGTNPIPADCKLLIIATQRKELAFLTTNEIVQIRDYLRHDNGRLLALLNTTEGLEPILNEWGAVLGNGPVVDRDPKAAIAGLGEEVFLASPAMMADQAIHPIVLPMATEGMKLLMIAPRPIFGSTNLQGPGGPKLTALAATSTNGVELGTERHLAFPLIVAIEKGVITGQDGTRIVLAGDADFLSDQVIGGSAANNRFAALALNWLLQRPDLALQGLGPRAIQEYKLVLTERQAAELRWLFLAAMPGAVLLLGGLVWLRRRS